MTFRKFFYRLISVICCIAVLIFGNPIIVESAESKAIACSNSQSTAAANKNQEKQKAAQVLASLSLLEPSKDYASNEVIVSAASKADAMRIAVGYNADLKTYNPHGFAVLMLSKGNSVLDAVKKGAEPDNDLPPAYPNGICSLDGTEAVNVPNDPDLGRQPYHKLLGDYDAWSITKGTSDVVVAVIDTGIDIDHPEFTGRISPCSYNVCTKQVGIQYAADDETHGTHVAGIIAAAQGNDFGGSGIAPNVTIMAIKVISEGWIFNSDVIDGIYYAVDHGADVINLSLGESFEDPLEHAAIQYAVSQGTVVVCSAGNQASSEPHFPAAYPESIAVTASDNKGEFNAGFSNYGSYVDLCAPGTSIFSSIPDNTFTFMGGTSMAAPMVSGFAALLKSYDPDSSVDQIKNIMYSSATDKGTPGFDDYYGNGFINILKALDSDNTAGSVLEPAFPGSGTSSDPYIISTPDHLLQMKDLINMGVSGFPTANYQLAQDLDLVNSGIWTPIGVDSFAGTYFRGTFDGNGHIISGLRISQKTNIGRDNYIGLFGFNDGRIQNLNLMDAQISFDGTGFTTAIGGICGYNSSNASIINCCFEGEIESSAVYTGGLVGYNRGEITCCHNAGQIKAVNTAGGIAGSSENSATEITSCSNSGIISSRVNSAGGITGLNSCIISNCFNAGIIISSENSAGGISGACQMQILNSYNTGSIISNGIHAGGISGLLSNGGYLSCCYNTGLISGTATSSGGIVGRIYSGYTGNCYYLDTTEKGVGSGTDSACRLSLAAMTRQETYNGFDFSSVWQMIDGVVNPPVFRSDYHALAGIALSSAELVIGERCRILIPTPLETAMTNLNWTYDSAIIAIDCNGYVTALAAGTTTVTASSSQGGYTASCEIIVRQGITSISIPGSMSLAVGETSSVQTVVVPANAFNQILHWSSSNPAAASVDELGQVTANCTGYSIITASAMDGSGIKSTCIVTVVRRVTAISLAPGETAVSKGHTLRLTANVKPIDATNLDVIWQSNNPNIAEIDTMGVITGKALGSVTITATTEDGGFSASCDIRVVEPVASIRINESNPVINVGGLIQLSTTVLPATAYNKTVCWSSSDENVATVDTKGLVTGKRDGTVYIIARTKDSDLTAGCYLTVGLGDKRISISGPGTLLVGQVASYKASLFEYDNHGQEILWDANNQECATIDENGNLRANRAGDVLICAISYPDPKSSNRIYGTKIVKIQSIVSFCTNGGSAVQSVAADYDATIKEPTKPVRSGYTLSGWYKDIACTQKWNFLVDTVTTDITLYAKWTVNRPATIAAKSNSYNSIKLSWNVSSGINGYEIYRSTSSAGTYLLLKTLTIGSSASYIDTSLSTGKVYYYKLRTYKYAGTTKQYSSFTPTVSCSPTPSVPGNARVCSTSYKSIKVSWSVVPGASGYQVYRANSPTGAYAYNTRLQGGYYTSMTDISVTTGYSYYYKVRAYRETSFGRIYSPWTSLLSCKPVPSAPGSFAVTRYSSTSIRMSWSAVSGATAYQVWRATSAGGTYSLIKTTSSRSYLNTGLRTGTTYYYKVRAYHVEGAAKIFGAFSSVKYARP